MNSKVAFRNTLKLTNTDRPVFVPFVYGLAAKISQLPLQEMVSDATYYTHSLEEAYKLFRYDGIVNSYDCTLEAETFGCELEWSGDYVAPRTTGCNKVELREVNPEESSRIPILLETTKRVVMSQGKEAAVIAVLTGPCSLVKTITGDEEGENIENVISLAGKLLTKITRSLCELKIDAVFFREDLL
jgi:uroporphyrinogen-III decarboxylase